MLTNNIVGCLNDLAVDSGKTFSSTYGMLFLFLHPRYMFHNIVYVFPVETMFGW